MKRKTISLLLIIAITFALLAGCTRAGQDNTVGASAPPSEEITATLPQTEAPTTAPETTGSPETAPSVNTDYAGKKLIAITYDDGPGKYTYNLITELNNRGVKATFFMLGQNAERYPDTIKYMSDSGHELGSHTYDHSSITKLTNDAIAQQLSSTDNAIEKACGKKAISFRPPGGAYNAEKLAAIDKTVAMWSVDTRDWESRNAEAAKQKMLESAKDGSIILFHDIYETSVAGSLAGIDELLKQGYVFVTLEELLQRGGKTIEAHKPYFSSVPVA